MHAIRERLASVLLGLAVLGGSEAGAESRGRATLRLSVRRRPLSILSSGSYGFTFDVRVRDEALVDFLYIRQDNGLDLRRRDGGKQTLFDMNVEYYQGGGLIEFGDDTCGLSSLSARGSPAWRKAENIDSE